MDIADAPAGERKSDRALPALVFGFLLLVVTVAGSIWLTARQQRAFEWVTHTLQVENELSLLLSRLQDAETGGRGYLLTGRDEFLGPYEAAVAAIPGELAELRRDVADNPAQVASFERLARVSAARIDHVRVSIEQYRTGTGNTPEHFLHGRALMDEARRLVAAMKAQEDGLLAVRTADADRQTRLTIASLVASALLTALLAVFAFVSLRRRLAEALESRRALLAEAANREEAEAQIRQMQKVEAIGQLTGGIAHDFNNMLTLVIGSLDLAHRRLEAGATEKVRKCIDNAMEGAQRAAQLTARLLAFSRQQPLAPQPVDVNKLVGGMSELLRRTIGENLQVETVLAGGLWRSFADPSQLESALINLCVNARDAMPDGGKLTIETANAHLDDEYAAIHADVAPGQYVLIGVTDTGTGMPAGVIERAFDPFYTTKGPGKGTGLGLSQVHGFVKQSRGHLKIYSEPGHGTTLKIYLPRHSGDEAERAPVDVSAGALPRAKDHELILVVEDEEQVRQITTESLRELGYVVLDAPDGVRALAILALQPGLSLLLTDVVMPGMNGRQLAERARAERPGLKVLYTTGYTKNAIVHNGMLDPGVAFLAKPFTVDQLARKVRQVLDEDAS